MGNQLALFPYGELPPHQRCSETSKEAAGLIVEDLGRLQQMVLGHIRKYGEHGRTCDEVEVDLELRHQTASARIRELALNRFVVDSGMRRLTRSNRRAVVWRAR